jgi:hypothetical protein
MMALNFDAHYDNKTSAEERGKSFSLETEKTVRRYTVDGGLIQDDRAKKCDYLFEVGNISCVFYVELKGTGYADAIEQLRTTIIHEDIEKRHRCVPRKEAHVVLSRSRPKDDGKRRRARDRFFGELRIRLFFKNTRQIIAV